MKHLLKILSLIALALLALVSPAASQEEGCEPVIEAGEHPIAGPEAVTVGGEGRYCLEISAALCGRCDGRACYKELIYKWSFSRSLPDGSIGGDLAISDNNTLACIDVEGKTEGAVMLSVDVLLNCTEPKKKCSNQTAETYEVKVYVLKP